MGRRRILVVLFVVMGIMLIAGCGEDPVQKKFEQAEKDLYNASSEKGYEDVVETFHNIYSEHSHTEWAPKALFRSGVVNCLYLKRYDDAIEDFAYLIYYYPDDKLAFEAQTSIVNIYVDKLGDYGQAIVELRKLIENYPDQDEIDQYQYKLAQCYYLMRDFDQARLEYLILLDSYPRTDLKPQIYYDIANTFFVEGSGKLDKAIEYYTKLIEEYPDSPLVMEARFYSAAALEEKGELDKALAAYGELLRIYPNPRMVALRIEGVKNIIEKKAAPAPTESFMGLSDTDEGDNAESGNGNPPEVGGTEKPDGITIKSPEKKKNEEIKKNDTEK